MSIKKNASKCLTALLTGCITFSSFSTVSFAAGASSTDIVPEGYVSVLDIQNSVPDELFAEEAQSIMDEIKSPINKYLSDFEGSELVRAKVGWGSYTRDMNLSGNQIVLKYDGATINFKKGVLAHASSDLIYDLGENNEYDYFSAYLGVDKSQPRGNVKFTVQLSNDNRTWADAYQSEAILGSGEADYVNLALNGARYLRIVISDNGGNGNDHAAIADGMVYSEGYSVDGQTIIQKQAYYEDALVKNFGSIENALAGDSITAEAELSLLQYNLVRNARYVALNGFLTDDEMGAQNQEFMQFFFNDLDMMRMYAAAGTPEGGSYINSLKVLSKLYNEYKDVLGDATPLRTVDGTRGGLYTKMMMAVSMTHAARITNWMDGKEASDPLVRFATYKDMYEAGVLNDKIFETLEPEELRWVVNNMMYDVEIPWTNDYARNHPRSASERDNSFPMLYSPHHHIRYTGGYNYSKDIYRDPERFDEWDAKYNLSAFNLPYETGTNLMWHLFEEGSVCGGISKTGTNIAQSFGVPASAIGQPGHCAFLIYSLDANGNGVWGIDNDVSGWTGSEKGERMPLDWGNASDNWNSQYQVSYVGLSQAALNDYDNYLRAEEILMLANLPVSFEEKESVYREALAYMPYHFDAWYGLIRLYVDNGVDSAVLGDVVGEIASNMVGFPEPMYDLSGIAITELTKRANNGDADAATQLARANILRTASLRTSSTVTDSVMPNSNISRVMANSFLGKSNYILATFSFDGDDAGKLVFNDMFDSVRFKYSLSGSENRVWSDYVSADEENGKLVYALSAEEIEAITADGDITIVLEGLSDVEANCFTIDILDSNAPTAFYANDKENRILGVSGDTYEYSVDGETWETLTSEVVFDGDVDVTVKQKAHDTHKASEATTYVFTQDEEKDFTRSYISIARESVVAVSSEEKGRNNAAIYAIDGNPDTHWHTSWSANSDTDRFIVIGLDAPTMISGIDYVPRTDSGINGNFTACSVYVSEDGENWTLAGRAEKLADNKEVKCLTFEPVLGQFVKVVADQGHGNFASAGSIELYECIEAPVVELTNEEKVVAMYNEFVEITEMVDPSTISEIVITTFDFGNGIASTDEEQFVMDTVSERFAEIEGDYSLYYYDGYIIVGWQPEADGEWLYVIDGEFTPESELFGE